MTAVIPYFSYAKGDKKDEPRVSIRARVCADAIEAAGADRVLTMDLHSPQIQGFFNVPVDHLYALPVLLDYVKKQKISDLVVVSPDAGGVALVRISIHASASCTAAWCWRAEVAAAIEWESSTPMGSMTMRRMVMETTTSRMLTPSSGRGRCVDLRRRARCLFPTTREFGGLAPLPKGKRSGDMAGSHEARGGL